MADLVLILWFKGEATQVPLTGTSLTIGRGGAADVSVDDHGLSLVHARINRDRDRVWISDEGSTNGSYVNDQLVGVNGTPLSDGDEIRIGEGTVLRVTVSSPGSEHVRKRATAANKSPAVIAYLAPVVVLAIVATVTGVRFFSRPDAEPDSGHKVVTGIDNQNQSTRPPDQHPPVTDDQTIADKRTTSTTPPTSQAAAQRRYLDMDEPAQSAFVENQARRIASMIGNRPYDFTEPVLRKIKARVDENARAKDLGSLYERATRYAPLIVREFKSQGIHGAVGLYMTWIESKFHPDARSYVGAEGMFQFMPGTALEYGVSPSERVNPEKLAPAAAKYFAHMIEQFGSDAMSVPLAIAAYNRGGGNIMGDLQKVMNSENRERSFWSLVANSEKLPTPFQRETISYVPKFFGAAIVGENPSMFGIDKRPLSTYE